jgi:two-component system cell cycle sensor histidine kinase/response regulator CckA
MFSIYLPRHIVEKETETPAPVAEAAAAKAKPADLTGQGTILLVEDEDGLRSLNARGLRSRGYTVIEAENGLDALEALEAEGGVVDLVVSDVVMPEMDGPTMLAAMRKTNPSLKIIFVSGYAEDAFEKSLPDGEQFAFLPKPFTLSQLVGAVKETMDA